MRIHLFCHSVLSDWNHGNAHFLRGVATELASRGHEVTCHESESAWSVANLVAQHGEGALAAARRAYPALRVHRYAADALDLERELEGADLVLVHEWNEPELVARIGALRAGRGDLRVLFHDTHHRTVTDPASIARFDLTHYDGVLAFGETVRARYAAAGWAERSWTWHEAADVRVFHPLPDVRCEGELVWVGNWGDEERTAELHEFLLRPVRDLGLVATAYGVRYPDAGRRAMEAAGFEVAGWLPNHRVPLVFARHRVTVHVPRRPYALALPGIPTIRVFEALACGIPLVCAPWEDSEGLFRPGTDYLVATDGAAMRRHLLAILCDPAFAADLRDRGLETIRARHTCAHRVDELLGICGGLGLDVGSTPAGGLEEAIA